LWMCLCILKYPECNVHAPYCHLWPARLYNIFPHYLTHCKIFGKKKLLKMQCVFLFFLQPLSETFLILRRNERGTIINVHRSSYQIEFSRKGVEKYSNINFHQNPSSGSRALPSGRMEKLTWRSLSQFCEGA